MTLAGSWLSSWMLLTLRTASGKCRWAPGPAPLPPKHRGDMTVVLKGLAWGWQGLAWDWQGAGWVSDWGWQGLVGASMGLADLTVLKGLVWGWLGLTGAGRGWMGLAWG